MRPLLLLGPVLAVAAVLVLLGASGTAGQIVTPDNCVYELTDSKGKAVSYDLGSMYQSATDYKSNALSTGYTVEWNICGLAHSTTCSSSLADAQAYRWYQSGTYHICTIIGASTKTTAKFLDAESPQAGITLTTTGANCYQNGAYVPYQTQIQIACDKSAEEPEVGTVTDTNCVAVMQMTAAAACPGGKGGGGGGGGGGGKDELSIGSALLITLLVCSVVYVGAGTYYNMRTHGLAGTEALPNREFWMALPGHVKDGWVFFWEKINAARGKGSTSYSTEAK